MTEEGFIALPRATAQDIRSRAGRANVRDVSSRLEHLGGSIPDATAPSPDAVYLEFPGTLGLNRYSLADKGPT